MLTLYNNIKKLRQDLGLTQQELAERMGYSDKSMIAKIENGKIDISQSKIVAFAKALNTTTAYLMGWEKSPDLPYTDNIFPIKKKQLPILGDIACGEPIFADEHFESYLSVDEEIQADFCLRCKGDSMVGARIYDGDIVLIRKQSDVSDGEIAAVYIDGSATLKRIYKLPGKLILRAENPSYPPIEVTADNCETLIILGKAVAFYGLVK
ncbi:MAG: LexA family transcriptional regulator [Clostridia bacterium]|nr:LexA family transcriptional regulator [Clostridia bacterium]